MSVNIYSKYFKQKRWSILEIICIVIAILAGFAATFVNGCGPIGFMLLGISICSLIFSKSAKVTDAAFDEELDRLIKENVSASELENAIKCYDFRVAPIVKGKDGAYRSACFVVIKLVFEKEISRIHVSRFDLFSNTITKDTFSLSSNEKIDLIQDNIHIVGNTKTVQYLVCENVAMNLPINTDDFQHIKTIERLLKNE
jgi:hypothetical protein